MNPGSALRRQRGFSVVELMVATVVGLLAVMFATRLIVSAEQNKSVSLGGSDSMQNGMLALFSLNGDAAQAGWGLNDTLISGCNASAFHDDNGFALATATRNGVSVTPLAPVIIQSNGRSPDQISFYAGSSANAVGSVVSTLAYVPGSNTITIATGANNAFGFLTNDVIAVVPEPSDGTCSVAQLSQMPLAGVLTFSAGLPTRFNNSAGLTGNNLGLNGARIFHLGPGNRLSLHTWSVNNGILLLRASDLAGAERQPVSVIDNVVSIKAQYGFDTRIMAPVYNPGPGGMVVTQWSGPMINADGDLDTGGAGDFQRIAAVRIAVVARSKTVEKPDRNTGHCSATTVLPTVFGSQSPAGVLASPMEIDVAVPGDTVDWRCYHYRVFETIVPIRNASWRP
ncbi:PilW family protein [Oxalobacteraceae bacterium]|nr:PilW family protein [Oxalobacteraceae bacterium]